MKASYLVPCFYTRAERMLWQESQNDPINACDAVPITPRVTLTALQ